MDKAQIQAAAQAIDRTIRWPSAIDRGPIVEFEDGSFAYLMSVEAAKAALKAVAQVEAEEGK